MIIIMTLTERIEILGEVTSKDSQTITLFMPMVIISHSDKEIPYFQLVPYCYYSRTTTFNKQHIISISSEPIPLVIKLWSQIVESDQNQQQGIAQPSSEEDLDDSEDDHDDNVVQLSSKKPTMH